MPEEAARFQRERYHVSRVDLVRLDPEFHSRVQILMASWKVHFVALHVVESEGIHILHSCARSDGREGGGHSVPFDDRIPDSFVCLSVALALRPAPR